MTCRSTVQQWPTVSGTTLQGTATLETPQVGWPTVSSIALLPGTTKRRRSAPNTFSAGAGLTMVGKQLPAWRAAEHRSLA